MTTSVSSETRAGLYGKGNDDMGEDYEGWRLGEWKNGRMEDGADSRSAWEEGGDIHEDVVSVRCVSL